ncbi:Ctr copper transporter [Pleurotus eryngii]|uniref:Copper transport protein n=1 Tax=Pleurotus eryngii TaxID=5323 RepID=A0A9P6DL27_PLEER|nr:Ctr copper transporter [Pleurotus eryngii]
MNHGGHGGHDMPMPKEPMCAMQMLWNTQIIDTCIVFPSWHIHSKAAFVFSFLVIVALGVFYEYLRAFSRNVDLRIAAALAKSGKGKSRILLGGSRSGSGRSTPEEDSDEAGLLSGRTLRPAVTGAPVPLTLRILRAVLYGATVFLSFFLMLVFMTYNAYLILAVVAGAAIGHFVFNSHIDLDAVSANGKGMACH